MSLFQESTVQLAGKVTGTVRLAFTSADHVHVSTENAYIGGDNGVQFRGRPWLVSIHLYRQADGSWSEGTEHRHGHEITDQKCWTPAPRTYRAAIVAAVIDVVAQVATADVLQAAHAGDIQRRRDRLEHEISQHAQELQRLRAELAELDEGSSFSISRA